MADHPPVASNAHLVLPAMLIAAMVALGIIGSHAPVESTRPGCVGGEVLSPGTNLVRSRLWQDPLDAIKELEGKPNVKTPAIAEIVTKRLECNESTDDSALILPVLLPGAPYADAIELRLRTRYAVLSALATAHYLPKDNEHLLVARVGSDEAQELSAILRFRDLCAALLGRLRGETQNAHQNSPWLIPYEWYSLDTTQGPLPFNPSKKVLLLWINQDQLKGKTDAKRFAYLTDYIFQPILKNLLPADWTEQQRRADCRAEFAVVGPADSNLLKDIATEIQDLQGPFRSYATYNKILFSPLATASDTLLGLDREKYGFALERTVPLDDDVSKALAAEIRLRYAGDNVAIISEWDTTYAQNLRHELSDKLKSEFGDKKIFQYSYLRGLDGRIPGEATNVAPQGSSGGTRQSLSLPGIGTPLPTPVSTPDSIGKSQADYLVRIGKSLLEKDRELQAVGERVSAIGILGDDVYDKLMILRALKPDFPDVVFFTTDLDARFLDKREREWTRNLVVVSGFGFRLNDDLQKSIPPFRDSYQTSTYFATLRALKFQKAALILSDALKPRVFEIGRAEAFDLSHEDSPLHPPSRRGETPLSFGWMKWIGIGLLLLLLLPLVNPSFIVNAFTTWVAGLYTATRAFIRRVARLPTSAESSSDPLQQPKADEYSRPSSLNYLVPFLVMAVILDVVLVYYIRVSHQSPGQEPWAASSGISVWPTILLRVFVMHLSILYIIYLKARLEDNHKELHELFFAHSTWRRHWSWSGLWSKAKTLSAWGDFIVLDRVEPRNIDDLWAMFNRRRYGWRLLRVILGTLLFFAAFLLLFPLHSLFVPARGAIGLWSHRFSIFLAVIPHLLLLFLVLDVTLLANWLVRHLLTPGQPISWRDNPQAESLRLQRGVGRDEIEKLLSIRLIAEHTSRIDWIAFPSVTLLILILSRHRIFDGWDWPKPLLTVFCANFVLLLYAAWGLRRHAQKNKKRVLRELRENLVCRPKDAALDGLIKEIEDERRGAFSSIGENPIIHALLIPGGSLGLIAALDYMAMF